MIAKWTGSPNFDKGRGGNAVSLIVIHHMVGTLVSTNAVFQNRQRNTSAHYGVGRSGEVHQYVSEADTAFHAGNYVINQRSIGIEHEDLGQDSFTDLEYATSAALIREIAQRYGFPINSTTIRPHRDIVATACPGSLDVERLITLANEGENIVASQDKADDLFVRLEYNNTFGVQPSDEEIRGYVDRGFTVEQVQRAFLVSEQRAQRMEDCDLGAKARSEGWQKRLIDSAEQAHSQQETIDGLNQQVAALRLELTAATQAPPLPVTPPATGQPSPGNQDNSSINNTSGTKEMLDKLAKQAKAFAAGIVAFLTAASIDPNVVLNPSKDGWKGVLAYIPAHLLTYWTKNKPKS